jgi:hypothetical protein
VPAESEEMTMEVKRGDGRVAIQGVKGCGPGDCASSIHGAQARILECLGEPLSYDDLVCYSGFAFRVQVHHQMCPSAGHPCCGFVCLENGLRALPWLLEVDSGRQENPSVGMQGNGWCLDVLIQNRRIAGRWVEQKAKAFKGDAAHQLPNREAGGPGGDADP